MISEFDIPSDGWKSIKESFSATDAPKFNSGHNVTYFVTRCVIDGLPSEDFKSISSHAINLLNVDMCRALKCVLFHQLSTYEPSANQK